MSHSLIHRAYHRLLAASVTIYVLASLAYTSSTLFGFTYPDSTLTANWTVLPNSQYQITVSNEISRATATVFMDIPGFASRVGTVSDPTGTGGYSAMSAYVNTGSNTTLVITRGFRNWVETAPFSSGSMNHLRVTLIPVPVQPAEVLKGSVTFGPSTDPLHPYAMIAKFQPSNGMSLDDAAGVLNVNHFNWVQTCMPPSHWNVLLTPVNPLLPPNSTPVPLPFIDPAPAVGFTYRITSTLPSATGAKWTVPVDPPSDGKGFYYNDGAETNSHRSADGKSLFFKDAAVFPNTFMQAGDSLLFTTRLAGVRVDGSYVFFAYNTGFVWRTDSVFNGASATSGGIYGMGPLKQTDETAVPLVLSGRIIDVRAIGPDFRTIYRDNALLHFSWSSAPGLTYQVQYSSDLSPNSWLNLGSPAVSTGSTMSGSDSTSNATRRFYRAILLQ